MDTKLAKKYTIIFLLVLNIILLSFNILLKDKYKLTNGKSDTIISFLEQDNIKTYTSLPKEYYPMEQITMEKTVYDNLTLTKIFLEQQYDYTITEQFEDTIIKQNDKTLTINPLFIYFQDLSTVDNFEYNKENSLNIAEQYKNKIEEFYGKLYEDRVVEGENYFSISYTKEINGYKIFNSSLNIKVFEEGQVEIYFNDYKNPEVISKKMDIYSVDVALYTFSKEIRNLIPDEEIYIRNIDLGYYLKIDENDISFSFLPYYRIFIKGNETPFYVNAYTNTFEYGTTIINPKTILY